MTLEVAQVDGTMLYANTPRTAVVGRAFKGYPGSNGRAIVLEDAPFSRVLECDFQSGGDDALSIWGDCHGSIVAGCHFYVDNWQQSKALICGADAGTPQPNFKAADGYAGQIIGCRLEGDATAARVSGGVWNFIDCEIHVSKLAGIDMMDGQINLIDCPFITRDKPDGVSWWYRDIGPCPIRVTALKNGVQSATNLKSSIFTRGCTLDGKPVTTADLLRRFNPSLGYDGPGSVPATCIRKTPN